MSVYLITDEELLAMGLGATALASIDSTVRTTHRGTASAVALSRLRVRWVVPSDWTPGDDVKRAVGAICAASLLGRRGYQPGAPADPIATAAADAMKWLDAVAEGSAKVLPLNVDTLEERRAPMVAGTNTSAWQSWRSGGCE